MKKNGKLKKIFYIFIVGCLLLGIGFILYCKIEERIYFKKGPNYEPKYSIYVISSPSMKPNLNKYDVIINRRMDNVDEIKKGDIITFISTNIDYNVRIVTHRVVGFTVDEKGNTCFVTKGDANNVEDSACARANNIIGKVVFRIPFIGFIGSTYGILFFLVIVITLCILKIIKKRK